MKKILGQFVEKDSNSGMASITKISYINEFVETKVRKRIDGLQFTKRILEESYGRVRS